MKTRATKKPAKKAAKNRSRHHGAPPEPSHDAIAQCAWFVWEEQGLPEGRDVDHWLIARAHLLEELRANGEPS
jgi:hypothetical protein